MEIARGARDRCRSARRFFFVDRGLLPFVASLVGIGISGCGGGESRSTSNDSHDRSSSGSVEVQLVFADQEVPSEIRIENATDPDECGRYFSRSPVVVDPESRGVRDVFGTLRAAGGGELPPGAVSEVAGEQGSFRLDNRDCRFEPGTGAVPAGTRLETANHDAVLHTVHLYGPREVNLSLPFEGSIAEVSLDEPGLYVVRCDVHGWMQSLLQVVEPGALPGLSDERGVIRWTSVPVGDYELELWHERFGSRKVPVTVQPGVVEMVTIRYSLREDNP